MSIFVLQSSSWGRERAGCFAEFVFLVSRDCCVAIPLSAMGLSAVCDCDTHYFWVSFMRTAMALATFAWSSLSLRHSLKFSCGDSNSD